MQLVFEHALRIRMEVDASHESTTPDSGALPPSSRTGNDTDGKGDHQTTGGKGPAKDLLGKINNLVSSDLNNVAWASPCIFFNGTLSLCILRRMMTSIVTSDRSSRVHRPQYGIPLSYPRLELT